VCELVVDVVCLIAPERDELAERPEEAPEGPKYRRPSCKIAFTRRTR
jgi:hypothetical protein